jgi:imidazole glycerol-phosphate synthase subunit HisF
MDVRRDAALGHRVYGRGGRDATGWSAMSWWSEVVTRGAGEVLLTSIDGDGTMDGFDLELVAQASQLPIPVIASGGGGRLEHFLEVLEAGADAVLAATVFHEERVGIGDLKRFLASRGQEVRL